VQVISITACLPVLRARRERTAEGVHVQRVDGAEVASHAPELLSVYGVEEARLELALRSAGGRHGLRVLATAQQNVRVRGRDHGAVHRAVGAVQPDHLQVVGVDQLRRAVLRRGDHHRLVAVKIEPVHAVRVDLLAGHLLAGLGVVLDHKAGVEAGDDVLVGDGPVDAGGLVVVVDGDNFVRDVKRGGIVLLCVRRCSARAKGFAVRNYENIMTVRGLNVPSVRSSGDGKENIDIVPRSLDVNGSAAVAKTWLPSPHFTERTTLKIPNTSVMYV
jgi:hypothetical protein